MVNRVGQQRSEARIVREGATSLACSWIGQSSSVAKVRKLRWAIRCIGVRELIPNRRVGVLRARISPLWSAHESRRRRVRVRSIIMTRSRPRRSRRVRKRIVGISPRRSRAVHPVPRFDIRHGVRALCAVAVSTWHIVVCGSVPPVPTFAVPTACTVISAIVFVDVVACADGLECAVVRGVHERWDPRTVLARHSPAPEEEEEGEQPGD